MEIDVKKEEDRVQAEVKDLVDGFNQRTQQINALQQQNQALANQILMKQGELELLKRLDGVKEESTAKVAE